MIREKSCLGRVMTIFWLSDRWMMDTSAAQTVLGKKVVKVTTFITKYWYVLAIKLYKLLLTEPA